MRDEMGWDGSKKEWWKMEGKIILWIFVDGWRFSNIRKFSEIYNFMLSVRWNEERVMEKKWFFRFVFIDVW